MIKVHIKAGGSEKKHDIRGIGVNTRELVKALSKIPEIRFVEDDNDADILHIPSFSLFSLNLPFKKKSKLVVTIHDLIPLIYPKHYPPGIKGRVSFQIQKRLIKNADAIITISETSKKDIVRLLGIEKEKIFPIYLAPQTHIHKITSNKVLEKIKEKYNLPKKFVFYVGDVNYNKNLYTLADACVVANATLVIVGKSAVQDIQNYYHIELQPFRDLIEKFGNSSYIKRVGFVEDDELSALYSLATLYCQPSYYEGFGFPTIEAMKVGVPVISAKTQALVEVNGKAAQYFNPDNSNELSALLRKNLKDDNLRKKYSKLGLKHVNKYSWEKTAEETYKVYKHLVNEK